MQIDWLTVAAQIVNFLALVWLLQRFLYRPITDAMRRREARIEARLAEARRARQDAEDEAGRLRRAQADLDARRDEILNAARHEAGELRETLAAGIREEMDARRAAWRDHIAGERDDFIAVLRRKAGGKVIEIARHVLADYAGSDLSDRVIATFADRLEGLDPDIREKMGAAASQEGARATVESGAAIGAASRARITRAIHEILSADPDVTFREDPGLVLGVRLTIGDHIAEWSAARYLGRLETELGEIIDAAGRAGGEARDDGRRRTA